MTRTILWILCLFISLSSIGQEEEIRLDYKPAKLYKLAKIAYDEGDYFLSNTYFEALKEKGFETDQQRFDYFKLLYKLNHYQDALTELDILDKNKFNDPLINYFKATLYYSLAKPKLANDYVNFFLKNKQNRTNYKVESSHLIALKNFIDSSKLKSDSLYAHVYTISNKINKSGAEFSPVITKNGLYFGSQGMDKVNYYEQKNFLKGKLEGTRKIYLAEGTGVHLNSITPFGVTLENLEISSFCFDKSQRVVYISACQYDEKLKKYICKIYQSKYKNKEWTAPEMIPEINILDYTSTHVNLGFDDTKNTSMLYFSSDRPGGRGGMDLWVSYLNARTLTFSTPRNLGSKINTLNDDITPFFHHPTNSLYFSSNGRGGYGGHDIYYSKFVNNIYSNIEHIGADVNSPQDDVFFSPDRTLEKGYFVSNRYSENSLIHPHCCDDIYYFDKKAPPVEKSAIKLDVLNKNLLPIKEFEYTISRIDSNKLTYIENGKGNKSIKINDLQKNKSYEIEVHSTSYFRKKILVEVKDDTLYVQKIELDSIDFLPVLLPLVEFDFDSFSLTPEARVIIDSLVLPVLIANPTLKIELGAHTDSRGDAIYNENLSYNRAKAIKNYLISHHDIDPRRLEHRGYGENVPVAPNEYEDGTDYPEGRQRNRRCEFRILPEEFDNY